MNPPRPIAVIVEGRTGLPVRLEAPAGMFKGITNPDGYVLFPSVPDADQMPKANLFVDDPSSEFYGIVIDLPAGAHQLFVGAGAQTPGFDITFPPLVSKAPPVPFLATRGRDIVDAQGKRRVLNGCDGFMDFRLFRDGGEAILAPFWRERRDLGFDVVRVFCQGAKQENTVMDLNPQEPGYYDDWPRYVDLANRNGCIVLMEVGVDNQVLKMGYDHWSHMWDLSRGKGVIPSGGNEASKNGFDRHLVPDPGMPLFTRGSGQQNELPVVPAGAMSFHPVRNMPTSLRDTVASPTEIFEVLHFPEIPLFWDEGVKWGPNGSGSEYLDLHLCERYAKHVAAECGLAVFHTFPGQRGQLMGAEHRALATAWTRGIKG